MDDLAFATEPMQIPYIGINIDPSRDARLTDQARDLLRKFYLGKDEKIQEGYARACVAWSTFKGDVDYALAQRLYEYVSKGWFGFASPVLSNAPLPGEKPRGLPISCFAGYVPDSLKGLIDHTSEFRWLSVKGGGVGGHWSSVRSVSEIAPGPIPFIKTLDADVLAYRQGVTRKGSYAAYLDISHPDIVEFIQLRIPTGDVSRKCLGTGFNHGVNITDAFMHAVENNMPWPLVDPHDKKVREVVSAREIWKLLLETRARTGEPYLNFIETAYRALPEAQRKLGLMLHGSNLCQEIHLPTGIDYTGQLRTFVCCLSSTNLEMYDEWKDVADKFIGDLITMLDNVLEHFIEHAPDELAPARHSARMERALGLGTMGLHSLLQRKGIPFESNASVEYDAHVHAVIRKAADKRSLELGTLRGEAPDMIGTGYRNSHKMSIAPTANNASICGTSPSVELWKSNAFAHRTRAGTHLVKNKYLEHVLETYGQNNDDVWKSILLNGGSVQHLDFLHDTHKAVYRTALEVDQMWVIKHAAARQKHICQGQSINLFFPPGSSREYVSKVHFAAWKRGLKGLYYYRAEARAKADQVSAKLERNALQDGDTVQLAGVGETQLDAVGVVTPTYESQEECLACQG